VILPARPADPPLDPSADEGRSLLRRELLRPEYNDQALVSRFVDWLRDRIIQGVDAASGSPPLTTLAAMVILVLLTVGLGWLLSRARLTSRAPGEGAPALTDDGLTAAQLRARADTAFTQGRYAEALVDGFRALALGQIERGRIEDVPGATARELADAMGTWSPARADRFDSVGRAFDLVLYGDRPATGEQARVVLNLDNEVTGIR